MNAKPYPKYKPSGVEWLGDIPELWSIKRLSEICKFHSGKAHEPFIDEEGEYVCVNARFVSTSGMTRKLCTENLCPAEEDDILMVMSDLPDGRALAKAYLVGHDEKLAVNQRVCRLRSFRDDPTFLYYSLDRHPGLLRFNDGVSQTHLSNSNYTKLDLPIPPIAEQTAIAAFLDERTAKLDGLLEKKRALIGKLKEKRSALISRTVTKGLPPEAAAQAGLNPKPKHKPSGIPWLGDIPEHWSAQKFGRCAFFQEGPGLRNWQFTVEGVKVICVTNITERGIDFTSFTKFISEDEYFSSYRHFTVSSGDLLLASSGNSWGKVAQYLENDTVILNTSTIRINRNAAETLKLPFILWTLQSETTREQLGVAMTGSCQPNFGPSHLSRVLVTVPSQAEQTAIAAYLDNETSKIDRMIQKVETAIEKLTEYRTALITAAVTGKIDVRKAS